MNKKFTQIRRKRYLPQLKSSLLKRKIYLFLCLLVPLWSAAQDVHFSQIHNAPLYTNPSLTGVFRGDIRFMANYRNQWQNVPVDYMTFGAAADMKFIRRTAKKGFFSGGLQFFYDRAGLTKLTLLNLALNASYTRQITDRMFASGGVMIGGSQRSFSLDGVRFDNQWNGNIVDISRPNGENFPSTNKLFLDLGAGINLRWQSLNTAALVDRLDHRTKVDLGVGVFHFHTPNQAFYEEDDASLEMRISPYVLSTIQVADEVDVIANLQGQFQGSYTEWVGILGGKLHLDRDLGNQWALQLELGYRFDDYGDAFFPGIELFYNSWQAGFSYDFNISDFDIATKRRGGPEFSIRYTIRKVRPLPVHKICPLI